MLVSTKDVAKADSSSPYLPDSGTRTNYLKETYSPCFPKTDKLAVARQADSRLFDRSLNSALATVSPRPQPRHQGRDSTHCPAEQ